MKTLLHTTVVFLTLLISSQGWAVTRTWTGAADTDFNNPNNWSPVGAIAGNDLIMNNTGTGNMTITMSATVTINSFTVNVSNTGDFTFNFGTNTLTTLGDFTVNSTNATGIINIEQQGGNCTVEGDFYFGNLNGAADHYYRANTTNPGRLTFKGNVTIGLNGRTVAAVEPDIVYDGVGTQTVTLNNQGQINGADYFLAEDLYIGMTNTPTVTITGTYQNSGGIRCYDGSVVYFKAGTKVECKGSTMDKLGPTNGTWTMEPGSEIEIDGTNNFPAGYATYNFDATSTQEYLGQNQSVTALTYGHLQFTGSGTKTSAGSFSIQGDLLTNTAFAHGSDVHTFIGTTMQTISGSVDPTFYRLTINNTSATGVDMQENVNVSNLLTLTDGVVTTNANILHVTSTATGSIVSHSTASYVNTVGNIGTLRRNVAATGGYDFPVGNVDSYQLLDLNLKALNTASYFDCSFENLAVSYGEFEEGGCTYSNITLNNGGIADGTGHATHGVWNLDPNSGTARYDITLNGRHFDNAGACGHTVIKKSSITTDTLHYEGFTSGTGTWTTSGAGPHQFKESTLDCNTYTLNSGTSGDGWVIATQACDGDATDNTTYLTSPVIDCSAHSDIILKFQHDFDKGGGGDRDEAIVQYNINGGGWTTLNNWTANIANAISEFYRLAAADGAASVQFRFQYDGKQGLFWAIDDVLITGTRPVAGSWQRDGEANGSSASATLVTASRADLYGFSQFAITVGIPTPTSISELINFTAKVENNEFVNLNWRTETETNNDYFTVERSKDGYVFNEVNVVSAAGNYSGISTYNLLDKNPLSGVSYYRLKLTDFDGSYTYSEIIAVKIEEQLHDVSVYPSPVKDMANLSFNLTNNEEVDIILYDVAGKLIFNEKKEAKKGNNKIVLNTSEYPNGIYFISIGTTDGLTNVKFIKK